MVGATFKFADNGPGGNRSPKSVIVTGIGYDQSVNIQFMPTLRKLVYVYAFGDRMGQISISGIAFDTTCTNNGSGGIGIDRLMRYYDKNRAVNEGRVVTVSIGSSAIRGFLINMSLRTISTEFKTTGFTMNLATLPRKQS